MGIEQTDNQTLQFKKDGVDDVSLRKAALLVRRIHVIYRVFPLLIAICPHIMLTS